MKKIITIAAVALAMIPAVASANVKIIGANVDPTEVAPGATTTLYMTVSRSGPRCFNNWVGTKVVIAGNSQNVEVPRPAQTLGNGTLSVSSVITVPQSEGTYQMQVEAWGGSEVGISCPDAVADTAVVQITVKAPAIEPAPQPAQLQNDVASFVAPTIAPAPQAVVTQMRPVQQVIPWRGSTKILLPADLIGGKYSPICDYVLAYQEACDPADYSTDSFLNDEAYRETILAQWRAVIFHGRYNQN